MKTSQEYRERIKAMRDNVYMDGELVSRDDPRIEPGMNVIAVTYDLPQDPQNMKASSLPPLISLARRSTVSATSTNPRKTC